MFSFNPELAAGDMFEEGDEAFDSYIRDDDEDEVNSEGGRFQVRFCFSLIMKYLCDYHKIIYLFFNY